MTDADRPLFAMELAIIAEQKRVDLTATLLHSYFDDLSAFTLNEIVVAVRTLRKTTQYFPQPVEIIDLIRGIRRRALAETLALPAAPLSEIQIAEAKQMIEDLHQTMRWTPPAGARQESLPEDEAEHVRRKADALRRFRA